jgi:hypothetical protein
MTVLWCGSRVRHVETQLKGAVVLLIVFSSTTTALDAAGKMLARQFCSLPIFKKKIATPICAELSRTQRAHYQ